MPTATLTPTDFEQYTLELINRARLNPAGEFDALIADAASGTGVQSNITSAISFFGVDLASFQAQLSGLSAVAPLAWNTSLAQAAADHTQLMIDNDSQSHQLPGEDGLSTRIVAAGYDNWSRVSENVYAYTKDAVHGHAGFFIDWGYDDEDFVNGTRIGDWQTTGDGIQDPPGHRTAILNDDLTEIGVGVLADDDDATEVGPYVMTQDFGNRRDYQAQLLGVVIDDADNDDFYDMGEGLGGVTVTATGAGGTVSTTTWEAGGYQMVLAAGDWTVTFSGGGLPGAITRSITMGTENLKLDVESDDAAPVTHERIVTGTSASETVAGTGGAAQMLIGAGGADTLTGATAADTLVGDRIEMVDHRAESDSVYRLYQATLDRAPDSGGQQDWVGRLLTGQADLATISAGFVGSQEFLNTYGASLTNSAFVELLYQNVLGRAADAAGLDFWLNRMAGGESRADVVLGFSESQEFVNATRAAAASFAAGQSPREWTDDVFRLYQATLDRAPDAAGLSNWIDQLGSGRAFSEVVTGFVASTEFQNTYGNLTNSGFVELLYRNVLGRAADAAGLADWTGRLDGGTSREDVVTGFAQSLEFINGTRDAVIAFMRGQATDDRLQPGSGQDHLYGGALRDSFVFDASAVQAGDSHRIHDLEDWDVIRLEGFGFADAAAALAAFSDGGNGVYTLTSGGMTLTVETDFLSAGAALGLEHIEIA